MRLPIAAVLFGVSITITQLGTSSVMAGDPDMVSLPEATTALCSVDLVTETLEPEVASACFEASRPTLIGKHLAQGESSPPLGREPAQLVHDPVSLAPEQPPVAAPRLTALVSGSTQELAIPQARPAIPPYHVEDNHDVRRFLDRYQTGYRRAVVERWLERAGRYLPMLLNVFKQKGLPEELVFTAMIESGFDPLAVSRAGAKGLWQFMAPTARRYGLRVDQWMDERLDPEKSTAAAARHFIDLYAVFGSWNLAQAAYNAGERTVLEAIRAMGTSDFWALTRGHRLADETKNFVPAIKAATLIAREPERYGFMVTPAPPLMYDVVSVPGSTNLKALATASGLDPESVERLNPELRLKQTPPDGPYRLKVPVGGASMVRAALDRGAAVRATADTKADMAAASTSSRLRPTVHVVKRQETVSTIAKRYGVTTADLIRWNNLDETGRIRPGDRLRVAEAGRGEQGQASPR
jgi:membrane-bound lytic murein transglycosylase D